MTTPPDEKIIGIDLGESSHTAITVYNVMDKDPTMIDFKAFMVKRDEELIAMFYGYLQDIEAEEHSA